MLSKQNILITVAGLMLTLLWGFVSAVTRGLPDAWCAALDRLSFHRFSSIIAKMANGFYYDLHNNDMPTVAFFVLFLIAAGIVFWVLLQIERAPFEKSSLALIVFFACLFRLLLLPSEPIHENDYYRYLWDGKSAKHGINPFKYAPSDLFMYEHGYSRDYWDAYNQVTLKGKNFTDVDGARLRRLIQLRDARPYQYARIGHWQVPTIYPPVAQAVFWLSAVLGGSSVWVLKGIFCLFDLGVIACIILLLKHFRLNPSMVVVYAWSPLVLKEFANSGHYDTVAIFFNMLAILLLFKGREAASVLSLVCAALAKYFSGFLLPVFLRRLRWRWVFLFVFCFGLAFIPYFLWDHCGIAGVFEGLRTYNAEWFYNASVFAVVFTGLKKISASLGQTLLPAKAIVGFLYLGLLAILFGKKEKGDLELLHRFFLAVGGLFILNPVGDPWYFCWSVPFLCFFPYRSWLLLSVTLVFSYINFLTLYPIVDMQFLGLPVVSWVIYLPFFLLGAWEAFCKPAFSREWKNIDN